MLDQNLCYRAVISRDARFDGQIYVGVTSTGIYCRPSCPAITPKKENMRFYPTSAAAQQAGFRACKRCRPDAVPGSPEWNLRNDIAGRAMRLIADGVIDRHGVKGLAMQLGYSSRQVSRHLLAEVGAGPLALARAQRAQTSRILLETTSLPVTDVAFAAGFSSVRQFNDTIRDIFSLTPSELRLRARGLRGSVRLEAGTIRLRLTYRAPLQFGELLTFLADRAVPGVEEVHGDTYRRVLRLPHGPSIVAVHEGESDAGAPPHLLCDLQLGDLRDLATAIQRCRRLFDLDADPAAVAEVLGEDPLLAPLVRRRPGLRALGHVDADELAIRAVLGQQVSVVAARTLAGRLSARYGTPLAQASGSLTHAFPTAAALSAADPADLPMPRTRQRALLALAAALAQGEIRLDPGADRDGVSSQLLALPGIGVWTVAYVRMRALGDPDAFLPTDLGVRHALERLGAPNDEKSALRLAERWRPWRSYALQHLWASLGDLPASAPKAAAPKQNRE
ncbi:MAG: helix-turn-helix domain-containing protein [Thermaerobacter sp.]|nr:helix-turn-helix domain-containing protein [Thermaerobacter sp.]